MATDQSRDGDQGHDDPLTVLPWWQQQCTGNNGGQEGGDGEGDNMETMVATSEDDATAAVMLEKVEIFSERCWIHS